MPTSKTLAVFDATVGLPPSTGYPQVDLRNDHVVLDFDDSSVEAIGFLSAMPRGYAGSDYEVVITWAASSATSGDVVWQAELERHPIDDATHGTLDLDADSFGTEASATSTAPTASGEIARTTIAITTAEAQSPTPGETYRLRVSRLAASVADTMVGDAELLVVELREV